MENITVTETKNVDININVKLSSPKVYPPDSIYIFFFINKFSKVSQSNGSEK